MSSRSLCKARALIVLAGLALVTGCVAIPVPEHGGRGGAVATGAVEKLTVGSTTRVEVLLALGEPTDRRAEDRAYVYQWERTVGEVAYPGGGSSIQKPRQLCLEFDRNGILTRKELFQPGMLSGVFSPAPLSLRPAQTNQGESGQQ